MDPDSNDLNVRAGRNPYPPDIPTRVAVVEERLDHIDELRVGRTLGEAVTELRLIRQQQENDSRSLATWQLSQDHRLKSIDDKLRNSIDRIKVLEDERKVRQGVTLSGKTLLAVIGTGGGLAAIIGLLAALLTGGQPT